MPKFERRMELHGKLSCEAKWSKGNSVQSKSRALYERNSNSSEKEGIGYEVTRGRIYWNQNLAYSNSLLYIKYFDYRKFISTPLK